MTPEQEWAEYNERKAAQERERDERTAKILGEYNQLIEQISSESLPMLNGSEKQVTWAESIRSTAQLQMRRMYQPGRPVMHIKDTVLADMRSMAAQLLNKEARWWINNRSRWM